MAFMMSWEKCYVNGLMKREVLGMEEVFEEVAEMRSCGLDG